MATIQLGLTSPGLIGPVIGLNLWTFVMQGWMYSVRLPALADKQWGVEATPELTPNDMATKLPPQVRWKAENYNHLHEQPTTFYAVALSLAILGVDDKYTVGAAWAYTAIRIVHSFVQSTSNNIMLRFKIFSLSSVTLAGLAARAAYILIKNRK